MKFFKVSLKENNASIVGATGDYFRILSGVEDVTITFNFAGGKTQTTRWKVGIGAKFPTKFDGLLIESAVDQVIEIAYGMGSIDDSRLTGDVDVNGLLSVVNKGGTAYTEKITPLVAGAVAVVADQNTNRAAGTFVADVSGRLWHDGMVSSTRGIPYTAGSVVQVQNSAELYFYPAAAGEAQLLEDIF